MISRYQVLSARIATELEQIRHAADRATAALRTNAAGEADRKFHVDSAALNLHAFYSGIEHLFEVIARELDGALPQGPAWHRELLRQMAMEIPGARPAVLRPTTQSALEEYLRFRHLVRNVYAWEFAPDKLAVLVDRLPAALHDLEVDLARFREFLNAASRADESASPAN